MYIFEKHGRWTWWINKKNWLITKFGKKKKNVINERFCSDAPAKSFILKTKVRLENCSRYTFKELFYQKYSLRVFEFRL